MIAVEISEKNRCTGEDNVKLCGMGGAVLLSNCRRADIVPGHARIHLAGSFSPVACTHDKPWLQSRLARPRADSDVSKHEIITPYK